jgi:tetratricopeptide (TPR) repeat protein
LCSLAFFHFLKKAGFNPMLSLAGALIFAVHPLNTNSVAWIAGRNDMIMALFCLLSFNFFLNYLKSGKSNDMVLHAVLLALAFLSKETALFLPFVLSAYIVVYKDLKSLRQIIQKLWPFWIACFSSFLILRFTASLGQEINQFGADVFLGNLRVIPVILQKLILPVNLSTLPTYSQFSILSGLILIAVLAFIYMFKIRQTGNRHFYFGLLMFLITILPSCIAGIKNNLNWNEYLETRAYLPIAGLIFLVAGLASKLIESKGRHFTASAAALVIVLMMLTITNSRNYASAVSYFENAVAKDNTRPLFHLQLSRLYVKKGKWDEAEKHLWKAANIRKDYFNTWYLAGKILFENNRLGKSEYYLSNAIRLDSSKENSWIMLADAYIIQGKYTLAIPLLEKALTRWPGTGLINYYLAYAYLASGEYNEADSCASRMKLNKMNTSDISMDYYKMANICYRQKNYPAMLRLLLKSVELDSNNKFTRRVLDSMKLVN